MVKCTFDKEYAREVFKVIPQADFLIAQDNGKCYWGTTAFAPDITDPVDVEEFFKIHETYIGFVDVDEDRMIWRSDANLQI